MAKWELVDNPAFAGMVPTPLDPACHDGSAFLTIECSCGFDNHVHESSIVEVPPTRAIGSLCNGCSGTLAFPPGYLHTAFLEMRQRGWSR